MKYIYTMVLVVSLTIGMYLLSQNPKEPITITVNSWTGYTPIFYAKEKGWLGKTNLNILHVATLSESLKFYKSGLSDGLTITNDIAIELQKQYKLTPVMILDCSDGGDKVLSNIALDQIRVMQSDIDVFLEIDSVNQLVFDGFIEYYDLNRSRYKLYNMSQSLLAQREMADNPTLVITYDPFSNILIEKGYQEIASSKLSTINILDLLMIKTSVYHNNKESLKQLREAINKAIQNLENDPYEFYQTIEHYLEGQSFKEFLRALDGIKLVKTEDDEKFYLQIYKKQNQEKNK